ncbi:MAG: hypothetical protein MJA27_08580 [Pseudanabaenales cyanobacterium]|nr:hypothetical protein [Pseudanabaenales cyanobacterium]
MGVAWDLIALVMAATHSSPKSLIRRQHNLLRGIVSNGQFWQFGKLNKNLFIKEFNSYTISAVEHLFSTVNYGFARCELELAAIEAQVVSHW